MIRPLVQTQSVAAAKENKTIETLLLFFCQSIASHICCLCPRLRSLTLKRSS